MDLNCRVCLQVSDIMVHLFEEVDQFQSDLASLLEDCGGIVVEQNDLFPKYLCQQCTQELLIVAEFRKKCESATNLLVKMQLADSNAELNDETDETLSTTECILPENSSNEFHSLTDNEISDLSKNQIEHTIALIPLKTDSNSILNTVSINVVFDKKSAIDSNKSLTNESTKNSNNVLPLSLHENDQTTPASQFSEETFSQIDAITTDADGFDNAYNSTDIPVSNEFADSIIEEIENGENELDYDQIEIVHTDASESLTENYKYACEVCGASFVKSANLRKHMEIEHNEKLTFFCDKCHRKFELEKDYKRHEEVCFQEITTINSENVQKIPKSSKKGSQTHSKYSCDYCGKCLQSLFSLRMHVRTHTGERPFSCDLCESHFKTQAALTAHQKRHTGKADFICEVCEKRFYELSNLLTHRRIHTGYKPHICNVCNKSFTRVYLLQLHMRTHTGERPFKCEHCFKTFTQNSDWKNHLAIHSGDRKYSCTSCPKKFIRRHQLEAHMKKHFFPSTQKTMEFNKSPIKSIERNDTKEELFSNVYNEMYLCDLNIIDEGGSYG